MAARHLLLIFEAYPLFEKIHKKEIIENFVSYVMQGITCKEHLEVIGVTRKNSYKKVRSLISDISGFQAVYESEAEEEEKEQKGEEFLEEAIAKVKCIVEERFQEYDETSEVANVAKITSISQEKIEDLMAKIEITAGELITLKYIHHQPFTTTPVYLISFDESFRQTFTRELYESLYELSEFSEGYEQEGGSRQQMLSKKMSDATQKLLTETTEDEFCKRRRVRRGTKVIREKDNFATNYSKVALGDKKICLDITSYSISFTCQNLKDILKSMDHVKLRILYNVLNQERKRLKEKMEPTLSIGELNRSADSSFYLTDIDTDSSQSLTSSSQSSSQQGSDAEDDAGSEPEPGIKPK